MAATREHAMEAYDEFVAQYKARYPKVVECLTKDKDVLFTFDDFPAEHWMHLRTSNPIESTFTTVRHRTRQKKGCGSRVATLSMVFKLVREVERRWRRLNGHALLAEVIKGGQVRGWHQAEAICGLKGASSEDALMRPNTTFDNISPK